MKTIDINTIKNNTDLLQNSFLTQVMGLNVKYFVNQGRDGRVKGLFEFNRKIIHGVSVDGNDINRDISVVEKKLKYKIYSAEICQYCGRETRWDSIHHKYHCDPCGANIGCHDGSPFKSLGSVANYELRELRTYLHHYFDQLWKYTYERGIIEKPERGSDAEYRRNWRNKCRMGAYKWLAYKMEISEEYCHIGMFDETQCEDGLCICIGYCKEKDLYYEEIRDMIKKRIIRYGKQ